MGVTKSKALTDSDINLTHSQSLTESSLLNIILAKRSIDFRKSVSVISWLDLKSANMSQTISAVIVVLITLKLVTGLKLAEDIVFIVLGLEVVEFFGFDIAWILLQIPGISNITKPTTSDSKTNFFQFNLT
jgi:hypothetical protein